MYLSGQWAARWGGYTTESVMHGHLVSVRRSSSQLYAISDPCLIPDCAGCWRRCTCVNNLHGVVSKTEQTWAEATTSWLQVQYCNHYITKPLARDMHQQCNVFGFHNTETLSHFIIRHHHHYHIHWKSTGYSIKVNFTRPLSGNISSILNSL